MAGGHRLAVEPAGPGRYHPQPRTVGYHQVAGAVHGHAAGQGQGRPGGEPAIAGAALVPVAGHQVDAPRGHRPAVERAGPGRHHPHRRRRDVPLQVRLRKVGDDEIPGPVWPHRPEIGAEPGLGGRAAVAGTALVPAPGHRVDITGRHRLAVERAGPGSHHPHERAERIAITAHARQAGVRDQQVPVPVEGDADRVEETRIDGRPAITGRRATAVGVCLPGHGVDVAGGHRLAVEGAGDGRDHPNPAAVSYHQVPRAVQRRPARLDRRVAADTDRGMDGSPAITIRPGRVISRDRGQSPGRLADPADRGGVPDIQRSGRHLNPAGLHRYRGRAARAAHTTRDRGDDPPGTWHPRRPAGLPGCQCQQRHQHQGRGERDQHATAPAQAPAAPWTVSGPAPPARRRYQNLASSHMSLTHPGPRRWTAGVVKAMIPPI